MFNMVVVNYQTPGDLRRFCDSVLANPPEIDWHLIVVNVDPRLPDKKESVGIQKLFSSTGVDVTVLNIVGNVGYARACNKAATLRSWDYIGFFNADTELRPGVVDACVEHLSHDPTIGVVGPRQVDLNGRLTAGGIGGTMARPKHRGWQEQDAGQYRDVIDCPTVSGAAYFIKRSVWDELRDCPVYRQSDPESVGAFLTTAHYWNETYTSYHAQKHGYRCVYLGTVTMIHAWHKASPIGGWGDQHIPVDQAFFRQACDQHGMEHD